VRSVETLDQPTIIEEMAKPVDELNDLWVFADGRMRAEGDAAIIDDLLEDKLERVGVGNWRFLYWERDGGHFWELTYPHGEMHGGGPRRLRRLAIDDQEQWTLG
jgi:hypothetical protein